MEFEFKKDMEDLSMASVEDYLQFEDIYWNVFPNSNHSTRGSQQNEPNLDAHCEPNAASGEDIEIGQFMPTNDLVDLDYTSLHVLSSSMSASASVSPPAVNAEPSASEPKASTSSGVRLRGRPSSGLSVKERKEKDKKTNRRSAKTYRQRNKEKDLKLELSLKHEENKNLQLKEELLRLKNGYDERKHTLTAKKRKHIDHLFAANTINLKEYSQLYSQLFN